MAAYAPKPTAAAQRRRARAARRRATPEGGGRLAADSAQGIGERSIAAVALHTRSPPQARTAARTAPRGVRPQLENATGVRCGPAANPSRGRARRAGGDFGGAGPAGRVGIGIIGEGEGGRGE